MRVASRGPDSAHLGSSFDNARGDQAREVGRQVPQPDPRSLDHWRGQYRLQRTFDRLSQFTPFTFTGRNRQRRPTAWAAEDLASRPGLSPTEESESRIRLSPPTSVAPSHTPCLAAVTARAGPGWPTFPARPARSARRCRFHL